jgi:hypothetical protein
MNEPGFKENYGTDKTPQQDDDELPQISAIHCRQQFVNQFQ